MEITNRQCRRRAFAVIQNALRSQENVGSAVSGRSIGPEVRDRFRLHKKFQARCDGKLYDFVETVARGKLG